MKIKIKKIICSILFGLIFISTYSSALSISEKSNAGNEKDTIDLTESNKYNNLFDTSEDIDPLIDLKITITIKEIRALDDIDILGYPDFYVKVFVNNEEFDSGVWHNQKYIEYPWPIGPIDVSDYEENVSIKIQLWDWNHGKDKLCDINSIYDQNYVDKHDLELVYSLKTGHWYGDDFNYPSNMYYDLSGYGRANGCDDRSISNDGDRDCELLFDITQNDFDNDTIPYWTEVNVYGTDPKINDIGRDDDCDGVPIEWEHRWGHYFKMDWHHETYTHTWIYNPFIWEDHINLDPDEDGLQNVEEYLTSQWGSDPFRKDIFMELDQMEKGPNGEGGFLPNSSKELIRDAFSKRNIVLRIDDGCMGGGELIPFNISTPNEDLQKLYWQYFLHNNSDNWRRGTFHYTLLVYNSSYPGFVFSTRNDSSVLMDALQLGTKSHEWDPIYRAPIINSIRRRSFNFEYQKAVSYASVLMHETGHILGINGGNTPGCDKRDLKNHIKYFNYKSCMNYFYVYYKIDYSDGSHGKYDFDDWDRIDLTLFQIERTT